MNHFGKNWVLSAVVLALALVSLRCDSTGEPKITYSATAFTEAAANDGTIGNTITATLTNAKFTVASGDLTLDTDYTLSGNALPAGLTLKVTVDSATQATISLAGAATSHVAANNVDGIVLALNAAAFKATGTAVDGLTFSVSFDDAAAPLDTDKDGIPDATDPTPNGSTANQLNSTYSGGHAQVVTITAYDNAGAEDTGIIYDDDLTQGCDYDWGPQGSLCDEAPTTDSETTGTKSFADSGATWDALDSGSLAATGVLVIDACKDASCTRIDFNEARVFQMFSDGKTTQVRLAVHAETGDTPPAWDDAGWTTINDFADIGAGTNFSTDAITVTDPTVLAVGPHVTRYVRAETRNDGTQMDADYIEFRAIKLFSKALE